MKLKSSILICILALFFINFSSSSVENCINEYQQLISEVYNLSSSSGIFFVTTKNYQSFAWFTFAHKMSRTLSKNLIPSVVVSFDELEERMMFYRDKILRPLIVVLLGTMRGVKQLETVSQRIDMSFPMWLVIFTNSPMSQNSSTCQYCIEPNKNKISLKFDVEMFVWCCCKPNRLYEWYSMRENFIESHIFANWDKEVGLTLTSNDSIFIRRYSLRNHPIKIAIVNTSSVFWLNKKQKKPNYSGLFAGVLYELSHSMNFEVKIVYEETSFGTFDVKTKKWSGIVGRIANGDADLGVAELSMTTLRRHAVDFTVPLILTPWKLYFKLPDGARVQWSAYFQAFESNIWIFIIIVITTTPLILTFLQYNRNIHCLSSFIIEKYLHVWGIFCQQGLSRFPTDFPSRIAYFSTYLSAIVVLAAYSAALISFLAVSTPNIPFNTFEGFIKDGSYKLIVIKDSADYDFFTLSDDKVLQQMKALMIPKEILPTSPSSALIQVCYQKVALYITEEIKGTVRENLPCKITHIDTGRLDSIAMIVPRNSPYSKLINYHIHRFKVNGVLNRLKGLYSHKIIPFKSNHSQVSWWGIAPILAVVSGGIIIGIILLFIEKLYHYYTNHQPTQSNKFIPQRHEKINFHFTN